jgi:hypothetical protein
MLIDFSALLVEPVFGWANMTQTAKLTASGGDPLGGGLAIGGNTEGAAWSAATGY